MALLHSTNIYWRKFFIFLILVIVGASIFAVWKKQNPASAEFQFAQTPNYLSLGQVNMAVDVRSDGKVLIDGKDASRTLKILPDCYEISIIALDEPGSFINEFKATMNLPRAIQTDQVKQIVYAIHGIESYQAYVLGPRTIVYTAKNIPPMATLTIVAKLPQDILTPPLSKRIIFAFSQISIKSYLVLAIGMPLLTLFVLILMVLRRQQDKIFYTSRKIINAPPDATAPPVIGALFNSQLGSREIAAILIDLACRGYLFIIRKGDDFSFGKRKSLRLEEMPELRTYERILLSKIFELQKYKSTREDVEMRIGRHIFSRKIAEVYLNIYNEAMSLGYFVKNPAAVHLRWKYTGIFLFFLSVLGFLRAAIYDPDPKFTLFFWVGAMAMAAVVVKLSGLMPVRSVTGTTALRRWLEFYHYLKMRRPIEGGIALMDKFIQYLPYAIVFGVEAEWAKRFINQTFAKPDWYEADESVVTLETFIGGLYPIINFVGGGLHKSHEPTVE